jgi:hypothetical protein
MADETTERVPAGSGEQAEGVNQGATGTRPLGESPLNAQTENQTDAYDERPEAFVGAAFAGGLVVALILRKIAK